MDRILKLLGGSFLAIGLLFGCANNDQNPPPENVNDQGDNDNRELDDTTGTENKGVNPNRDNGTNMDNNNGVNEKDEVRDEGDVPGDADPTRDHNNAPADDLIEDNLDGKDNNQDDR